MLEHRARIVIDAPTTWLPPSCLWEAGRGSYALLRFPLTHITATAAATTTNRLRHVWSLQAAARDPS